MEAVAGSWAVSKPPPFAGAHRARPTGVQSKSHSSSFFAFHSARSCATPGIRFFASRPWVSQTPRRRSKYAQQFTQPLAAAQEAAQPEERIEELVESSDDEFTNGNGAAGIASPSLVDEFRAVLAAEDEETIGKFEAQVDDLQSDRDSLVGQVAALEEETQKAKDRLLRLNADFENFRKRTLTEKASLSSSVKGDFIETLLPMVDNFERAKSSIRVETEGEEKIDRSYQGIYKQFVEIMKGLGVVAVETVGKKFDPNLHEAIMREDSSEYEEGIVLQEFRRGFCIGDKLIRPAMVKVSAGPGPAVKEGGPEEPAVGVQNGRDEIEKTA